MSDWKFLNEHRLRLRGNPWGSTAADGFNGVFEAMINGLPVRMVASDGLGWQHVSVSIVDKPHFTPSWEMMCKVKDLFWEPEDTVMQLHPPRSLYVNFHPGCLHMWRPVMPGVEIPIPHPIMVGPKSNQKEQS